METLALRALFIYVVQESADRHAATLTSWKDRAYSVAYWLLLWTFLIGPILGGILKGFFLSIPHTSHLSGLTTLIGSGDSNSIMNDL